MATHNNGNFPANLPILNGKNYDNWCKQMKVVFGFQDVWDLVENGLEPIGARATEEQQTAHKEKKKRDFKALFIIHQCVDSDNFEKVGDAESAKEAWDTLHKTYGGADKIKKVRLQTHKRQYELLQMEEKETINDFFARIGKLVNQMKSCGETVSEQSLVEKILRSLSSRFDTVVIAMMESKDLTTTTKEELQGSLEAHEQRMNERVSEKSKTEVALQAQSVKDKKEKGKWNGNRGRANHRNSNGRFGDQGSTSNNQRGDGSGSSNGGSNGYSKGGGNSRGRGGKKKFNRSNVQCYNCQKFGHFADQCYATKKDNSEDDAKFARQDDDEVLLMVTTTEEANSGDMWYLDTGCSTHMTGRRDWFVKINSTSKSKVKFADDSTLSAEGIGEVLIKKKDGGQSLISEVLYIPGMKSNLLSIGQLLEKGYRVLLEDKMMRVHDPKGKLILKAPMSRNRTFKIELNVMEHKCYATAVSRDEWLWHYRLGHLNFRDLKSMQKYGMVSGLPEIHVPTEVCEECVQAKQHRNNFSKNAGSKTKNVLEVVYSDVCGPIQVESTGGNKYFVTFIDDFSRKLWTYLIKRKSEVFEVFRKLKSLVEKQSGYKIKTLRTDGGGEYVSSEFEVFCTKEGIVHDVVPPYTPQQNGTAERKNRTIMNMVRSMLKSKHLPKELWGEAVSTATYTLNRCPTRKLNNVTPEECWSGNKPNVNHLRVFGSITYRHIPDQLRRKLDDKSETLILVGYHSTGGYKLLDPVNKQVIISRDVIIDEVK